ncbi:hypothetical protein KQI11_05630 [Acetanaerobacterium sp. MSJ-12]|uniref:hypothetical protein n=1 Tax=Acetanaerobacterium sp. MSJ-12 TaxID=2841535 RepID=UPI001C0F1ADE|nr:hypothetical protein [Acetanaerobacterium sp. MSJ-12]MBU5419600.1 hypothetical protein [Acetanaerobacterium sp. MSJ-12]
MFPVSEAYLNDIFAPSRRAKGQLADTSGNLLLSAEQVKTIEISGLANSGGDIAPGAFLSDELKVAVTDPDGAIAAIQWEGKEVVPQLGIETAAGLELVPMGVFVVQKPEQKNGALLTLKGADRACKAEAAWTTENEVWPMTLAQLVGRACEIAGIELGSANFPNASLLIEQGAAVETTARAMIAYAAQVAGCYARMGRDGRLYLRWYSSSNREIGPESTTEAMRAQYATRPIDQVRVIAEEGDLGMNYPEGVEARAPLVIENNPLLYALTAASKEEQQDVLKSIYDGVAGYSYAPLEWRGQGDPSIEPGDIVTIKNAYGEAAQLPVMEWAITYNGGLKMELRSVGTSPSTEPKRGPLNESIKVLRQKSNVLERELDYTRSEIKEVSHTADAIVTEVTELTQRVDGLVLSASRTGGANRIKGSSGRLGLDDWQVDGQVVCDTSTAVYNSTAAGGCFVLGLTGRLGQTIPTVAGKRYAYYCQYKLETGASTSAYISHGGHRRELAAAEEWTEITGSFVADSPAALVEAMVEGGTLRIADWTVIQGEVCTAWQQAQNEIDAGGVKITSRGIDITKEGDPFQASLDNQQVRFRNTDTSEDVAYFNKDSGRIRQLSALGEFTVQRPDDISGALRVIPVAGGAFFVIND